MLLWCSADSSSIRAHYGPIYVAAFAVALGKYGLDSILKEFLSEQLIEGEKENSNESEAQIEGRTNVWWCIASISGSAIAVFWLSYVTWERAFLACNVMMGASLLLFLCGFKFYCPERHNRNSHVIFKVFKAAISKRYLAYPGTPTQLSWKSEPNLKLYEEKNSQILLLPKVFWFRLVSFSRCYTHFVRMCFQNTFYNLTKIKFFKLMWCSIESIHMMWGIHGVIMLMQVVRQSCCDYPKQSAE